MRKVSIFLCVLILVFLAFYYLYHAPARVVQYGMSFSAKYARELGLNPQEVYTQMLTELKPTSVKLATYFNEVQPQKEHYRWEELDSFIDQNNKTGIPVILAIGLRTPRWPECHIPDWYASLSKQEQERALLGYIRTMVQRYDDSVIAWQVENEPYLEVFGNCPNFDLSLFKKEIALVRSLSKKPILSTSSGELGNWSRVAKDVDIVGISMYRVVWNPTLKYYYHTVTTPAAFYAIHRFVYELTTDKPIYVTELQAEPWAGKPMRELSLEEEGHSMSHPHFARIFRFFEKTGFDKAYLWGVEWWYYKKQQGDSYYWNFVKDKQYEF